MPMPAQESGIELKSEFVNVMKVGGETGWFVEDNIAGSTGYSWLFTPDNSGVYELVDAITLHASTGAVGVPGKIIWKFRAIKEGHGNALFTLTPPGSSKPAVTKIVAIEVSK